MFFQKYVVPITIFFICLIILGQGSVTIAADKNNAPQISPDQVKQLMGLPQTVIIDVRRSRSWWQSSKKIANAVREDPSSVAKWAKKYAKDATLIFYCS